MAAPTVLSQAQAQAALVRSADGFIQTVPFLDLCRLVLPVVGEHRRQRCASADSQGQEPARFRLQVARHLQATPRRCPSAADPGAAALCQCPLADRLGSAFALVKSDIQGNIQVWAPKQTALRARASARGSFPHTNRLPAPPRTTAGTGAGL